MELLQIHEMRVVLHFYSFNLHVKPTLVFLIYQENSSLQVWNHLQVARCRYVQEILAGQ